MTHIAVKFPSLPASTPAVRHFDTAIRLPRSDDPLDLDDWLTSHAGQAWRRRLAKGAHLFVEGSEPEHLYLFVSGWAIKYKSLFEGRRQILDFVLPGEPLGFIGTQRAPYGVEMLNAAEVIAIPRGVFEAHFAADPRFAAAICRQLEASAARAHERMTSIGHRAARTRVCRLLVELVERALPADQRCGSIDCVLPVTQRHIADSAVLRVETVCRVLIQLDAQGLAVVKRGAVHIPDLEALCSAC